MILYYLILISALPLAHPQTYTIQNQKLSIKAGIAVVNFNSQDTGTVTINYAKPMPDDSYKTLVTMAYINNYLPSKGLNFSANCSNESNQVQIKCALIAESNSSNNILYLTYMVSGQGDFIVGSFPIEFYLSSTTLKAPVDYNLSLPSDTPFRVARNSIDFIPMISGVSSLDSDFALIFSIDQNFQASTLTLHFSKNLTIVFGFILFLADRYPVSVYGSKRYEPNNPAINKNILYGINQINTITAIEQTSKLAPAGLAPPNSSLIYRLTIPTSNKKLSNNTSSNNTSYTNTTSTNTSSANKASTNTSYNPVRLLQIIEQGKVVANLAAKPDKQKTNQSVKLDKLDKFTAYISEFQKLISDNLFELNQVKVRSVTEQQIKNKTLKSNHPNIYVPLPPQLRTPTNSNTSITEVNSPVLQLNNKAMQPAPAPIIPPATDANDFEQIFATNGFSFIVNTTISDPVLYLELDPYVNIQSAKTLKPGQAYNYIVSQQAQPSPIYISQPINVQAAGAIDCPNGFMVSVQKRISILQRAYRNICVYCFWHQYFDWSLKKCLDLPKITEYVNVIDLVL